MTEANYTEQDYADRDNASQDNAEASYADPSYAEQTYGSMQERYGVSLFQAAELASQVVQVYLSEQVQRPLSDRRGPVPTDVDVALRLLAIVQGQGE